MLFAVGGLESADLSPDHCELYVSWQAIPWDGQVHTSVEDCMAVQGLSLISVCMIGLRKEQNILSPRRMFRRRFTCFCLCTDIVISFFDIGHGWDNMGLVPSNHFGLFLSRGDRERCWRTSRFALRDNAGWDIRLCLDFTVFVAVDVVCCAAENIDQAVTHSHRLRV